MSLTLRNNFSAEGSAMRVDLASLQSTPHAPREAIPHAEREEYFAQQEVKYVKPHGGLYHQANRDDRYAEAVIAATECFGLIVMGLPGSRLEALASGRCPFVAEGFADRRYQPDGSLVPRDRPNAFIDDPDEAVRQVEWLLRERGTRSICVHGDNPNALVFVRALREALLSKGFTIRPFA